MGLPALAAGTSADSYKPAGKLVGNSPDGKDLDMASWIRCMPTIKSVASKAPLDLVSASVQIAPNCANGRLDLMKMSLAFSPSSKPLAGPEETNMRRNLVLFSADTGGNPAGTCAAEATPGTETP